MKYLKLYEQFRLITERKEELNKVISYPGIKSNPNLPPLLLIPGGGGNPKSDYTVLAPLLSDSFNLLTFYYNESKNGNAKDVCSDIANQLEEKLGDKLSQLNVLGFSMGTSFGFWILKSLGQKFKGKFICVDAAAPQAASSDRYVHNTLKHNTPRRYQCIVLPFYEVDRKTGKFPLKEGEEANENQALSFGYSFSKEIESKIEKDDSDFNLENCKVDDFVFNAQAEYESWRKSKSLVVEFIDQPNKIGKGEHYPSKVNPSGIWLKGKKFELPDNYFGNRTIKSSSKNVYPDVDFIKDLIKVNGIKDPNDVWVVQDKQWDGPFFCDPKCDWKGNIDFLSKQANGLVGTIMRDPKKPETLDNKVQVIIVRAGRTKDGNLTQAEAEKNKNEFPNDNTKVVVLNGVEHFNICQNGAPQIAEIAKNFFK